MAHPHAATRDTLHKLYRDKTCQMADAIYAFMRETHKARQEIDALHTYEARRLMLHAYANTILETFYQAIQQDKHDIKGLLEALR